jgi:hypothetical protein
LAVNAGGDIFVACTGNNIYKLAATTYAQTTISNPSFNSTFGLAVDSQGNVFVADHGSYKVFEIEASNGVVSANSPIVQIGNHSWQSPTAVAVDGSGNVYVADNTASVYEIVASNGTVSSASTVNKLATGFSFQQPVGLALDQHGDLFVSDAQLQNIVEIEASVGGLSGSSPAFLLGNSFIHAGGVAVGFNGNIFVSFAGNGFPSNGEVVQLNPNGVSLGTSPVGTQSATTVTIPFIFDSADHIINIEVLTQGVASSDFANAGSSCVIQARPSGYSCTVDVTFTPTQLGTRYGAVVLYDINGPMATANLYGTGTGPLVNFTPYTQSTLSGPFTEPLGIASNGHGDLFVMDAGTTLYKETNNGDGTYTQSTIVASGDTFASPSQTLGGDWDVAIDGAGNLYLANQGGNSIIKMPLATNGTYSESTATVICASGCSGNQIVADANGNLYTLSGGTREIQKLTPQPDGSYVLSVPYNGNTGSINLGNPWGIAVDSSGNIFFTDRDLHTLYELTYSNGTYASSPTVLDSSFTAPGEIAFDTNGNLYITDQGSGGSSAGTLFEETPPYGSSHKSTIVSSLNNPYGVFLDNTNNVYVGNFGGGNVIKLDTSDAPAPAFPNTDVRASSNPITYTLTNQGTAPLIFTHPSSGTNPSWSGPFAPSLGSGSECPELTTSSSVQTLGVGDSCTLPIVFTPIASGPGTGPISIKSNNLNASPSTLSIPPTGTGITPAPAISSVSPTSGPVAGGTTVTILGTDLSGATSVSFGGTSATIVSNSSTQIVVTAPPGSAATVEITVLYGVLGTYTPSTYTYIPVPTVTGVSPSTGLVAGGTSVTITGTGFTTATSVNFGSTVISSPNFTVNSDTSITVTSPAGSVGTVHLAVTNPTATSATSTADRFTYVVAPTVTSISPATGPTSGGTVVTLTGSAFTGATAVTFGSIAATSFTVVNDTTITATSPPGANTTNGYADITVTSANGTSATSANDRFTYSLSEPVGTASVTQTATVTITTAGILNHVGVVTQGAYNLDYTFVAGGTCVGGSTYAVSNTCTVEYKFTPTQPGIRPGGISLTDSSGNVLGSTYVSGTGIGPQLTFWNSTTPLTTLGTGFTQDFGLAVDASGNVYVGVYGEDAVKRIPVGCFTSSCVQTLGGTFSGAFGVAVDGLGNVLVATPTTIFSIPPGCATSGCVSTVVTGFSNATGMALDGADNIYIGDFGTQAVREIPAGCSNISCVVTLGGGFGNLEGVAVDVSGNVYVAELGQSTIKRIPPGCTQSACVISLGGGLTGPRGVAVDSAGNVYVADTSATAIKFVPSNCTTSTCVSTLASYATGINSPFAVTVDQSGNVYIANSGAGSVLELPLATASTLTFPSTVVGATSSAQIVTLGNTGNASLTLSALTPTNAVFSSPAGNCTTTASLASGTTCSLGVEFAPTSAGTSVSGSVVVSDNALNVTGATQTISISGPATPATPTVTGITPTSGGSLGGTTVTITGTNFTHTATVGFGSNAATNVTYVNSTSLTATSPAGTGTVDVTVTSTAGTSAINSVDHFSYLTATTAVSSTTLTANQATTGFTPVTATGGTGTLAYSISPTLPSGLMLNTSTGVTTGMPIATIAATSFTVTATDQNGATSSATFSLTVLAPTLTLSPSTLPAPQVGVAYSQTLMASGGIAPYTWSVGSGSLPAGLTLSSTGVLDHFHR